MNLVKASSGCSKKIVILMQSLVISLAVGLPWLQSHYINPMFEQIMLQGSEEEAERVANYVRHAVLEQYGYVHTPLSEQFDVDVFKIKGITLRYLNQVINDFSIWKVKLFDHSGKVIFSTIDEEIGTISKRQYFYNIVAEGHNYTKTSYKNISEDGENHYFAEVYIPIVQDNTFIGAFELYYDITDRKNALDNLINNTNTITIWLSLTSILLVLLMGILLDWQRSLREDYEEELVDLASIDQLTQLVNRNSMDLAIEKGIKRFHEKEIDYCLIMFDVDHFKQVNDIHGHQAGDEVLTGLANITKNRLRETDIIGRYGGEEFVVLLSNTNASGGKALAENLRKIVEKTPIPTCSGDIHITISLGVGAFNDVSDLSIKSLLKEVDSAMYKSKHSGRNTVRYIHEE